MSPDGSVMNADEQTNSTLLIQKVYPNPTSNFVNLEIGYISSLTDKGVVQIDVLDVTGRVVKQTQEQLSNGSNTVELDIHALSRGLYLVRIRDANKHEAMVKVSKF